MILNFPDVRQQESYSCGVGAVASILDYFLIPYKWGQIRKELGSTGYRGTHPASFEPFFLHQQMKSLSGTMDVEDLKYFTKRGRPVIVAGKLSDGEGHYIVVTGVQRKWIYYHDPESGPQKCPIKEFNQIWFDLDSHGVVYDHWGFAVWR